MDTLLYLPTAQTLAWSQPSPTRDLLLGVAQSTHPARAYAIRATVTLDADFGGLTITRLAGMPPLLFFQALEQPLPLIARPRDLWYPQLTARVRPERHPRQPRPDDLTVWGPPHASLAAIRESLPINDPRSGHYLGRAFWRVDAQGYWGCWSDSTENIGPALTLAELTALLTAVRGIYAD